MHTFARGDRLPGLTPPLPESIAAEGGLRWVIYVMQKRPTFGIVRAFESSLVELAIAREGPVLLSYVRIDEVLGWSAAAWPWWHRRTPEMAVDIPNVGGIAQLVLVDCGDARVRALRTVGLTLNVAAHLRELERAAQAEGHDESAWQDAIATTRTIPPKEIARRAAAAAVVTGVPAKKN